MKIRNHVLILDISKNTEQVSVNLGAGDTSNRLIVKLYENGSQKELDDCSAVFSMPRGGSSASDYTILEGCTTVGDQIEYVFSAAAVSMVGSFPSTIIVYDDEGNILYTPSVRINVRETPYDDAKVSASGSYTAITNWKSSVDSAISNLNAIANSLSSNTYISALKNATWKIEFDYATRLLELYLDGTKVADKVIPVPTAEQVVGKNNLERFKTLTDSLIYENQDDYNEVDDINTSLESQVPVVGSNVKISVSIVGCKIINKGSEYVSGNTIRAAYGEKFIARVVPIGDNKVITNVDSSDATAKVTYFSNGTYEASIYVDSITKEFSISAESDNIVCLGLSTNAANVTAKSGTTLNTLYNGYFRVRAAIEGISDLKDLSLDEITVKFGASIGSYSKGATFTTVQPGINQLVVSYKSKDITIFVNGVADETEPEEDDDATVTINLENCVSTYNGQTISSGETELTLKKGDLFQLNVSPLYLTSIVYSVSCDDASANVMYYQGSSKTGAYIAISKLQGDVEITVKSKFASVQSIYPNVSAITVPVGTSFASLMEYGSIKINAKYESVPEDRELTYSDVTITNAESGAAVTEVSSSTNQYRFTFGNKSCDVTVFYKT